MDAGNLNLYIYIMFSFAWSILRFQSGFKPLTMNRDPLLQIVDSVLTLTTREVATNIGVAAFIAGDIDSVLNRFTVQSLTHAKDDKKTPHHEVLIVELIDTDAAPSESRHLLILERNSSEVKSVDPSPPGALVKSFKEAPAAIFASLSRSKDRLGYQAVKDKDSESTSLQLPLMDAASLAFAGVARASTHSFSPVYMALDTFRGGKGLELYAKSIRNIRQIRPLGLSFFDLVMLADSIHDHQPHYSSLERQCFWYARTICIIVEQEYRCLEVITGPSSSFGESVGDSMHPTDYLPDLSGRVKGVLVSAPDEISESDLVANLVANFKKVLADKREEVSFRIVHLEC